MWPPFLVNCNASTDLITDQGFNLLDFATDMKAFSGKNLSFTTLISVPVNYVTVPESGNPSGTGDTTVALNAPYGIPCVY